MTIPCELSAVLCTHNPRRDILTRTLAFLRAQTLQLSRWELVLVDNGSSPELRREVDLSWHPNGRLVEEPEPGANPARQCGLRSSVGKLLVLVDDDNILDPDYLATALSIAERWPMLGAFGGNTIGEFEESCPDWLLPYQSILAIREVKRELWTNIESDLSHLPFGAGMCFRRSVADRYVQEVAAHPLKRCLGRRADYDVSGEDPDIACTAFDLGLGVGLFPGLRLRHFMPAGRINESSVLRVACGNMAGVILLKYLRGRVDLGQFNRWRRVRDWSHVWRMSGFNRKINRARLQGETAAFKTICEFEKGKLKTSEDFRTSYSRNMRRAIL